MKPVNLTKSLNKYKRGWVALDQKNRIVAHEQTFALIIEKIKGNKNLFLVPASKKYFGFVTEILNA